MNFDTLHNITNAGFQGFVTVSELWSGEVSRIPAGKGVYMVVRASETQPQFVEVGTGGHFKGKNPNISIEELKRNWIEGTCVIYIGKATSLRKRLGQYLRFGHGKPTGHWGGRLIWQLKDAEDLLFCWKELPEKDDPDKIETSLIEYFKEQYEGRRPFANLAK